MSKIGLVVALPNEAKTVLASARECDKLYKITNQLVMFVGGMGAHNARYAAQRLHDAGCQHLISWGVAGGLDPKLQAGDLLIPNYIVDGDQRIECHNGFAAPIMASPYFRVNSKSIVNATNVISHTKEKQQLFEQTRAVAVDMESFSIGQYAQKNKLLFTVLRSVVDTAKQLLPKTAVCAVDEKGQFQLGAFLGSLVSRPFDIFALMQCAFAMKSAQKTLHSVANILKANTEV